MARIHMAFKTALKAISLTALLFPLAAQVVVEDEIVTSEVRILDLDAAYRYNITAAMGLSVVMPGLGHYYVDKPVSAYAYMSIDIASIFGAVVFNSLGNMREKEARSYAVHAAVIERAPSSGEAYWRHVGAFMDAAEYNEVIELSRGVPSEQYLDPETWWRWGDEEQKEKYNDMRQKARNMRVASSFFIGALAANRIVSTVDLRVFQRKRLSRGIKFESALTPDLKDALLALRLDF